jgi:ferredoxin-type protein NapH
MSLRPLRAAPVAGAAPRAGGAPPARRFGPWRRATQLSIALLYLALPFVNAAGLRAALGSLAATRVGPVDLVEPAAALGALFAGGAETPAGAILLGAAPAALLALLLGPVFCSWLCPFGLLSEGIDRLRARGRAWAPAAHERVRATRALFLAAVLAASALAALPLGALLQGPRAVTVAALEGVYLGAVSPFAAAVLGGLLLADLLLPRRLFCRALCPAGAVANFLRTPRTLRVVHGRARCTCEGEPRCLTTCPWGVDPRTASRFDGCTSCLACVDACPSGTLRPTFLPFPRSKLTRSPGDSA